MHYWKKIIWRWLKFKLLNGKNFHISKNWYKLTAIWTAVDKRHQRYIEQINQPFTMIRTNQISKLFEIILFQRFICIILKYVDNYDDLDQFGYIPWPMLFRLKLLKLLGKTKFIWGIIWGDQLFWNMFGIAYTGITGKIIYFNIYIPLECQLQPHQNSISKKYHGSCECWEYIARRVVFRSKLA